MVLLQQGDYALINAGHHLSAADSKVGSAIDGKCSNRHDTYALVHDCSR